MTRQVMTPAEHQELRRAVLGRVDTFTTSVEWIGGSADVAFASSVIELLDWWITRRADR